MSLDDADSFAAEQFGLGPESPYFWLAEQAARDLFPARQSRRRVWRTLRERHVDEDGEESSVIVLDLDDGRHRERWIQELHSYEEDGELYETPYYYKEDDEETTDWLPKVAYYRRCLEEFQENGMTNGYEDGEDDFDREDFDHEDRDDGRHGGRSRQSLSDDQYDGESSEVVSRGEPDARLRLSSEESEEEHLGERYDPEDGDPSPSALRSSRRERMSRESSYEESVESASYDSRPGRATSRQTSQSDPLRSPTSEAESDPRLRLSSDTHSEPSATPPHDEQRRSSEGRRLMVRSHSRDSYNQDLAPMDITDFDGSGNDGDGVERGLGGMDLREVGIFEDEVDVEVSRSADLSSRFKSPASERPVPPKAFPSEERTAASKFGEGEWKREKVSGEEAPMDQAQGGDVSRPTDLGRDSLIMLVSGPERFNEEDDNGEVADDLQSSAGIPPVELKKAVQLSTVPSETKSLDTGHQDKEIGNRNDEQMRKQTGAQQVPTEWPSQKTVSIGGMVATHGSLGSEELRASSFKLHSTSNPETPLDEAQSRNDTEALTQTIGTLQLKLKVESLTHEIEALRLNLAASQKDARDQRTARGELQRGIEELRSDLRDKTEGETFWKDKCESQTRSLRVENSGLQLKVQDLEAEIVKLKLRSASRRALDDQLSPEDLKEELHKTSEAYEATVKANEQSINEITRLSAKLAEALAKQSEAEAAAKASARSETIAKDEAKSAEASLRTAAIELNQLQEAHAAARAEVLDLHKELTEARSAITRLRMASRTADEAAAAVKAEALAMQTEADAANSVRIRVESELRSKIEYLEKFIHEAENDKATDSRRMERKVSTLVDEAKATEERLQVSERRRAEFEKRYKDSEDDLAAEREICRKHTSTISLLQDEIVNTKVPLQEENQRLLAAVEQKDSQLRDLLRQFHEFEKSHAAEKKKLADEVESKVPELAGMAVKRANETWQKRLQDDVAEAQRRTQQKADAEIVQLRKSTADLMERNRALQLEVNTLRLESKTHAREAQLLRTESRAAKGVRSSADGNVGQGNGRSNANTSASFSFGMPSFGELRSLEAQSRGVSFAGVADPMTQAQTIAIAAVSSQLDFLTRNLSQVVAQSQTKSFGMSFVHTPPDDSVSYMFQEAGDASSAARAVVDTSTSRDVNEKIEEFKDISIHTAALIKVDTPLGLPSKDVSSSEQRAEPRTASASKIAAQSAKERLLLSSSASPSAPQFSSPPRRKLDSRVLENKTPTRDLSDLHDSGFHSGVWAARYGKR